ncbi:3-methyl-2-oxobutanoate hydroxymethyltransferase [Bartonella sp. HY406]|uniref:3-methyl-2-oxobutanoate hydroxymethyltransferase n=1 Tax=Bartonella sp. HY406 TaxID=2979331 RepID=UPI0021C8BB98|nr:3-methyl-2-oxobutanoate hydroxymethyltransferase [Bartonella sp. HY406]UXN04421.1 3-methyl-2-oxobutanoate hydroxymethyltransferase [Bartonella sp. HY406]
MSKPITIRRKTAPQIQAQKGQTPIVSLTAYHVFMAQIADQYCDFLLVGDSVGMVVHGLSSTIPVTLEMMITHGQAVMRGTQRAMVIIDMPFGSYEESPEQAFRNAARIMQETGCGGVKLEGGMKQAATVKFLTERGIPVMGHIGLTPQSFNTFGGFKTQGRNEESWQEIEKDAKAIEEAGAFAVVIEGVVEPLAKKITQMVAIPTIGIGASNACDGQVLVMEDMLGMSNHKAKFVRQYANFEHAMDRAFAQYAEDVKNRAFPSEDEVYR